MRVIALPCRSGEFGFCNLKSVQEVLSPYQQDSRLAIDERATLRIGDADYDITLSSFQGVGDAVGSITVHRADHAIELWDLQLRLSEASKMLLLGDALGEIGALAAVDAVAEEMPAETLRGFGHPLVTKDPNEALAAIAGERPT